MSMYAERWPWTVHAAGSRRRWRRDGSSIAAKDRGTDEDAPKMGACRDGRMKNEYDRTGMDSAAHERGDGMRRGAPGFDPQVFDGGSLA